MGRFLQHVARPPTDHRGHDELEGFYMACGFSGHGFMLAPMTGLLLSEIILKQPATVDTTTLDLRRFHHQQAIDVEKSVV
jgi:sarcosine oxidase subunit beta